MAIYLVTRDNAPAGEKPRMIEARTRIAAIAFAARSSFGAEPLSTKQALSWSKQGIELEEATTIADE
jgi:hypothetical protein